MTVQCNACRSFNRMFFLKMDGETNKILSLFLFTIFLITSISTKWTHYIATEHPKVTYYNPKYLSDISFTARRYGRRDPIYYLNLHAELLVSLDNNVTINFYAFQFPSNGHTFMELHYKWCNMVYRDEIVGSILRKFLPKSCPTPKGAYSLNNLTTTHVPSSFIKNLPFTKARLFVNSTRHNERFVEGYLDLDVKLIKSKT